MWLVPLGMAGLEGHDLEATGVVVVVRAGAAASSDIYTVYTYIYIWEARGCVVTGRRAAVMDGSDLGVQ